MQEKDDYDEQIARLERQILALKARGPLRRSPRNHDSTNPPAPPPTRKTPPPSQPDNEASTSSSNKGKEKENERYDDNSLMAMVCRHDIPLFLCNIVSAGEQQLYLITLIEHLFSYLPPEASILVFYDIGCTLERSLRIVRFKLSIIYLLYSYENLFSLEFHSLILKY